MACSSVIITIAAMRLTRQLDTAEAYSQVTAANCQGWAEKGKPAIAVIKAAIGTTVLVALFLFHYHQSVMPKRQTVIAVGLGQLLSLCITGTSSASSALWRHYSISIPFTQNLCNYILLAIIYTTFSRNKPSSSTSRFSWQCEWTDYTVCL